MSPTFKLDEGKKIQLLSSTSLVSPNDLASSQPLWEFLSPTSPLSVGREVEHDCLRKDAPFHRDDRARASVSLRHQTQIPQLVEAELLPFGEALP